MDASHEKFGNLFIQTLKEQLAAAGRGIDYVVVRNTTKPGGSVNNNKKQRLLQPCIGGLLQSCSTAKVLAGPCLVHLAVV